MKAEINSRFFRLFELLFLFVIVLAVLFPYSPIAHSLPSRDSGVFLYGGWRVSNGDVPYLQFWDHKPPVIYYIDALGLWLTPNSVWGVWWVEVASLGLAALAGYSLIKRLFGIHTAIITTFLWLFTSFYLLAGGNLTTEYGLPLQFSLLWLFHRAENNPAYRWHGFLIGAISVLLLLTRQNTIAIPLAIGIYLLLSRIVRRNYRGLIRDLLWILAGVMVILGVFIAYFAAKGALPAFWGTAFQYNFDYVEERDTADRFFSLFQGLNQLQSVGIAQLGFVGWFLTIIFLGFKNDLVKPNMRPALWMIAIGLPLEIWLVSLGGRPRIPYFLTPLPVLGISTGVVIWVILTSIPKEVPKYVPALMTVFMALVLWFVFIADYSEISQFYLEKASEPVIVSYIQHNSKPDDYVLMWGAETVYNFASRRASPTRFVYQTALYNEKNKANVIEFLTDILTKKPRMIILRVDDKLSDFRFAYRDNQIGGLMDQVKMLYPKPVKIQDWSVYYYSGQ